MPYEEDDEARQAARERLQARLERRGSANALNSSHSSRGASDSGSSAGVRSASDDEVPDNIEGGSRITLPAPLSRPKQDGSGQSGFAAAKERVGDFFEVSGQNRTVEIGPVSFDLPFDLPDRIPPIAVPIAAAVIVLLLVFAVLIPSCTRSSAPAPSDQSAPQASSQASTNVASAASASAASAQSGSTVQQVADATAEAEKAVKDARSVDSVDKADSQQAALVELLGDEASAKLLAQAKTDLDALWIAAHPKEYAFDGVEVQYKVLKLAADEPAALDYVRDFPDQYPAEGVNADKSLAMSTSSPAAGVPDTKIPHLYQWDERWGYTTYSSAPFGLTGCGPTSLAMVYQGLTGSNDKTPYDIGKLADEKGYMSEYEGTLGEFFIECAEELGLECEEIYPEADTIKSAVEHGQVVIANLAPGYFTTTGHYFVITGIADDGTAIVNDPYSVVRSGQTWDFETIASQSYTCYGYTRAGARAEATGANSRSDNSADAAEADDEATEQYDDSYVYYDTGDDEGVDEGDYYYEETDEEEGETGDGDAVYYEESEEEA